MGEDRLILSARRRLAVERISAASLVASPPPIDVTVRDVEDLDDGLLIVDEVDDPVGRAACAVQAGERTKQGLPTRWGASASGPLQNSSAAAATASGRPSARARRAGPRKTTR